MKSLKAAVIFAGLLRTVAAAQESDTYVQCTKRAATQAALNACSGDELARVDTELNRIYGQVLAIARNQPGAIAKARGQQRAWISYRDAYIEAMYPESNKQVAYGSIFAMNVNLLKAKLARQQIDALTDLLTQYKGSRE